MSQGSVESMADPNAIYKEKFRELTELLGRVPTSRDDGWLRLHEEYKRGWLPAEETVLAPKARGEKCDVQECVPGIRDQTDNTGVANVGKSSIAISAGNPGPMITTTRARNLASSEPLSGPGINQNGGEAVSEPELDANKPERAEGPMRGPNGGVLAVCVTCGGEWERPARRGRPSFKCGECR